ncbi:hypothetical protein P6F26_10785 [Roseibacterium sp. SDUM158017]|uniref:hypothetical protein n=1 Tax=Roseicyclus salinarum TaxID=3036773 RepID=UPI0024154CF3|nr:hypothetical protein [Roseibacterium sp. SDUM158017]MDG4648930.1 hypothetical protein [Roseibacterium sp. SDUM158017]
MAAFRDGRERCRKGRANDRTSFAFPVGAVLFRHDGSHGHSGHPRPPASPAEKPARAGVLSSHEEPGGVPAKMIDGFSQMLASDGACLALADVAPGVRLTRTVDDITWGVDKVNAVTMVSLEARSGVHRPSGPTLAGARDQTIAGWPFSWRQPSDSGSLPPLQQRVSCLQRSAAPNHSEQCCRQPHQGDPAQPEERHEPDGQRPEVRGPAFGQNLRDQVDREACPDR